MVIDKFFKNSRQAIEEVRKKVKDIQDNAQIEQPVKHVIIPHEKIPRMEMELSIFTIAKIVLVVLGFLALQNALVEILDILLIFFVSLFLAAAFNPGTDWLELKFHLPRWIGIIVLYVIVFGILVIIIGGVIPIIYDQLESMTQSFIVYLNEFMESDKSDDEWVKRITPMFEVLIDKVDREQLISSAQKYVESIVSNLGNFAQNTLGIAISVFNGIFNFILIILLTFFMVVERESIKVFFTTLFPVKYEEYISVKTARVQNKISDWVHGQAALFLIVALTTYFGLKIIGLIGAEVGDFAAMPGISQYALTLALVAGLAELLPYIGPMLAFLTAAPVAFNDSWFIGFWVVIFYAFLQFLEGNFIVPLVMKKAVGLSPIVTIIAMLIGWQFLDVWGMILSVPVAGIMSIFIDDLTDRRHSKSK